MKIAFFGTPSFAARILEDLINKGFKPVCVVTQTDKPQGRSGSAVTTATKEVALKHQIPVLQPLKASDPLFLEALATYKPDLLVVVAYGQILRQPLLDLAPLGAINVHTSLLPKLRGAAPMQWALIHGDKETGVTIMKMSLGMDEGDILLQIPCSIGPDYDLNDLREALLPLSAQALITVLNNYPQPGIPQDHALATYAPKLEAADARIDFQQTAEVVYNRLRGCNPEPGSWCTISIKGQQKKLKVIKSLKVNDLEIHASGQILSWNKKEGIVIGCSQGAIRFITIQLEGKKACEGDLFTLGYNKDDIVFN